MIRKVALYTVLAGAVGAVLYVLLFADSIREVYPGFSWLKAISLPILVVGCFYAVMERSVLIGAVTFIAAAVLPWVKFWVTAYWPWFKYYCLHFYH